MAMGAGTKPFIWGALRLATLLCTMFGFVEPASALPSYARQTGHPCIKCHVGGFGPQLTPYGVRFKIGAYTETDNKGLKIPVAAFAYGGFTHTSKDQVPPPLDEHANDNLTLDQISGFIAGRWFEDVGSFLQVTYNGNTEGLSTDNTDIRYAHDWVIGGTDAIIGVSVNNNPTVQDPFNTLFAWNFPYVSSAIAYGLGSTGTQISGGLGPAVHGETIYAFVNDSILAEVGTYQAWSTAMQVKLGLGAGHDIGRIDDSLYWRLAYLQDMNTQAFSVGLVGFNVSRQPERLDNGPVNRYRDIGVDGWYEFLGNGRHNLAAYASYVREDENLADVVANAPAGAVPNPNQRLYDFRLTGSYYYQQTYGLTISRFSKRGTSDVNLYPVTGSPDTTGSIFQIDYTPFGKADSWGRPFANVRLGLQYTVYDKYNGASSNWDGAGRNASDNNTLYFFIWAAI